MPLLTSDELAEFPEVPATEVVPAYIRRYLDMKAMSARHPAQVIGASNGAMIHDRPGFEVEFLQGGQEGEGAAYATDRHEVLMVHRGHWRLQWPGGAVNVGAGRYLCRAARNGAIAATDHDRRNRAVPGAQHRRSGRPDRRPVPN